MKEKRREKMKGKTKEKMKRDRGEKMVFFFRKMFENHQSPNPADELAQNVSKKIPVGRIIPPFFFESSESDRVFNYLHDLNSIFGSGELIENGLRRAR